MRLDDEIRQLRLRGWLVRERGIFACNAVRPERVQKIKLSRARILGAAVGQIDDLTLGRTVDGTVRLVHKIFKTLRMPMVAPGLALVAVHALLHDRPFPHNRDEATVQIRVEAILHRGAVDLRHQTAGANEALAVKSELLA